MYINVAQLPALLRSLMGRVTPMRLLSAEVLVGMRQIAAIGKDDAPQRRMTMSRHRRNRPSHSETQRNVIVITIKQAASAMARFVVAPHAYRRRRLASGGWRHDTGKSPLRFAIGKILRSDQRSAIGRLLEASIAT